MADDEKKLKEQQPEQTQEPANEIDDFTRALLERKAEISLFEEEEITSSDLEGSMSEMQRKNAEGAMLSALDQLRMSRGQVPIEEEESKFRQIYETEEPEKKEEQKTSAKKEKTSKSSSRTELKTNRYETKNREDHFEKAEERPVNSTPFYKKKKFWLWAAIIAIVACMFGVYYWKVAVYDPAHVFTAEQQTAYDKLVNYADEYSMMSDTEKQKLLNMQDDYNQLTDTQKEQINEYFADSRHVGMTYTDLLGQLQAAQAAAQQEANYNSLVDFANNYPNYTDEQKATLVNYLDIYNSLNDDQKAQVNAILAANTGADFMTLYNQFNPAAQTEEQSSDAAAEDSAANTAAVDTSAQAADLQSQLASLQEDRQNYIAFLNEEGMSQDNDSVLQEYNAQIDNIQAQLSALGY